MSLTPSLTHHYRNFTTSWPPKDLKFCTKILLCMFSPLVLWTTQMIQFRNQTHHLRLLRGCSRDTLKIGCFWASLKLQKCVCRLLKACLALLYCEHHYWLWLGTKDVFLDFFEDALKGNSKEMEKNKERWKFRENRGKQYLVLDITLYVSSCSHTLTNTQHGSMGQSNPTEIPVVRQGPLARKQSMSFHNPLKYSYSKFW